MINYDGSKSSRLTDAIHRAGHSFRQMSTGEFVASDDAAVQAIIDAFDPVAAALPDKVTAVKAEAQRRIYLVLPAHMQTNLMAQGLQNTLTYGPDSATWPADQQALKVYTDARWLRIKALREASNAIEAKLNAITDWQVLEAYDATTDADWPE